METLVLMEDIDKSFSGVKALNKCRFELLKGEAHALIGENGAGKSTLMKILTGIYKKDGGRVYYKGKEAEMNNPKDSLKSGISIIHQELNLMPHLTVAQNIFIGREPDKYGTKFIVNEKELNKKAKEILKLINLDVEPNKKVSELTVAKQQMIEIAKALSFEAEVLIMDEPTAALTESEIEDLFVTIAHLRDKGVGIVYISHRMEELKRICDRVTVMRDGCYINTSEINNITIDEIIKMMVGRTIFESVDEISVKHSNEEVLVVRNLSRGKELKDVTFNLNKGEILGFAGLMGAGRTEVARAIFGADKIDSGEIIVKGKVVDIKSPNDAVKHGIGYLSEDRKRYGLAVDMTVEENIVLASMKNYFNYIGYINTNKTSKISKKYVDLLKVKTPGIKQLVKNLSGGNQQKVVIGKWLARNCDILIFDEPTRGFDVGAKSEIYKLLNDLTKEGKSIIMISSELPEVLRMSHRVIVMCEGRITGELQIRDASQEKIMKYATQR
jgi:ribose transport system ATP-binding protein